MRIRNKDIPQWNLPPELVSNVIKFLNIFLVENSHVVQALPPFSPDHRHVLPQRHGTPALHSGTIPYQQPPVWAGLQPNSPPHVKSFRTKWRRGTHTHTHKNKQTLDLDCGCSCWEKVAVQSTKGNQTEQWTCTSGATSRLLELIFFPPSVPSPF